MQQMCCLGLVLDVLMTRLAWSCLALNFCYCLGLAASCLSSSEDIRISLEVTRLKTFNFHSYILFICISDRQWLVTVLTSSMYKNLRAAISIYIVFWQPCHGLEQPVYALPRLGFVSSASASVSWKRPHLHHWLYTLFLVKVVWLGMDKWGEDELKWYGRTGLVPEISVQE